MNALISCIIPVYNGERYLGEAIDSILAQTYRPIEVIVVDDGSTDSSAAVVLRYGVPVRYAYQENAGVAAAFNRGLRLATGEMFAFLAADDLWHPEKLALQFEHFARDDRLDACVTLIQNFWVAELRDEEERLKDTPIGRPMPGYTADTLLARRRVFDAVGPFDDGLQHAHDLAWFLRAAEHGATITLLPRVLAHRRLHKENRSRFLAGDSRRDFAAVLKASLDRRRKGGGPAARYTFPDGSPGGEGGNP
jgi:glycosyltransferase involved in cell wall biosynthesis